MYDTAPETPTYTYSVPEEIRRFIHFFHQHVTEQVIIRWKGFTSWYSRTSIIRTRRDLGK